MKNNYVKTYSLITNRNLQAEEVRPPECCKTNSNKILGLYNSILQAVMAYQKAVSNFIYNNYPEKLQALLETIVNALSNTLQNDVPVIMDINQVSRFCTENGLRIYPY